MAVLQRLSSRYRAIAQRNLYLSVALSELIAHLGRTGIPALAFKGPVAASHYRSPASRPFGDVDVLIPEERRADAFESLSVAAYRPLQESVEPSAYAMPFHREEGAVWVDLHWGFAKSWFGRSLTFEQLWRGGNLVTLGRQETRVFSLNDQLLHLCIHGAKHGPTPWPKLKWIVDVGTLLRASRPDGGRALLEHAEDVGCRRMLVLGLALAEEVLSMDLPRELHAAVRNESAVRRLAPRVTEALWSQGSASFEATDRIRFDLDTRERHRDRLAYLWDRALTAGPRDAEALPPGIRWPLLHRPVRLVRLAVRYGLAPRRLRRLLIPRS
jgi:hypothetical protein